MPLLVAGVGADDVDAALAAHDLTVLANPLNARSNLHGAPPSSAYRKRLSIALFRESPQGPYVGS